MPELIFSNYTNYFSCRKTISCASDFKRYLFTLYHIISLPIFVLSRLFLHAFKAFPNFSFVCFQWKIIWYLRKVNKLRLRESAMELTLGPHVWGSRVLTVPLCWRICTILWMIFKKRLLIEALCRSLFTKYAHCKPLFPFQNNA